MLFPWSIGIWSLVDPLTSEVCFFRFEALEIQPVIHINAIGNMNMLPLETLGAFFVAAIVMGLAPGPDNIFVLTQSALYGFRAGIMTTLGLMTGLFGHTAAVALGVAALFQTSEMAFTVLKCAGAAYLLYLAWLSFRSGASRAWLEQSTFP